MENPCILIVFFYYLSHHNVQNLIHLLHHLLCLVSIGKELVCLLLQLQTEQAPSILLVPLLPILPQRVLSIRGFIHLHHNLLDLSTGIIIKTIIRALLLHQFIWFHPLFPQKVSYYLFIFAWFDILFDCLIQNVFFLVYYVFYLSLNV